MSRLLSEVRQLSTLDPNPLLALATLTPLQLRPQLLDANLVHSAAVVRRLGRVTALLQRRSRQKSRRHCPGVQSGSSTTRLATQDAPDLAALQWWIRRTLSLQLASKAACRCLLDLELARRHLPAFPPLGKLRRLHLL